MGRREKAAPGGGGGGGGGGVGGLGVDGPNIVRKKCLVWGEGGEKEKKEPKRSEKENHCPCSTPKDMFRNSLYGPGKGSVGGLGRFCLNISR